MIGIKWGPPIARGSALWPEGQERPLWLRGDAECMVLWLHGKETDPYKVGHIYGFDTGSVNAIRLPATHEASIAQRWNDDHPNERPFNRPWFGGEDAPADWDEDENEVLLRDGVIENAYGPSWIWKPEGEHDDIIAYRATENIGNMPLRDNSADTVDPAIYSRMVALLRQQVKKLDGVKTGDEGVAEARRIVALIDPPTPAQRIHTAHPDIPLEHIERVLAEVGK